jgi:shikimate dehydrogenase
VTGAGEPPSIVTLLGDPVAGNPTQAMMEAAFAAAGLHWRYVPFRVAAADLPAAVAGLRALGVRGSHVTVPHKVAVVPLLDSLRPVARACGAVNCITATAGGLVGDNTDGRGFVVELARHRPISGSSVVVLGAGGAARAITVELMSAGAARITVVNRDRVRLDRMVSAVRDAAPRVAVAAVSWSGDYVASADADVVVNATSIGLGDGGADVPVDLRALRSDAIVADVIPNPPHTALLRRAAAHGLRTITGRGMLVEQAVDAARQWTGQTLDAAVMHAALSAATDG